MGRSPCCSKVGLNRGAWTAGEDKILTDYIKLHGEGKWRYLPKNAGLKRCGKSCRLRWLNYLRPDIKRGNISHDEEELIIRLHKLLGNRWSLIAGRLPGRTDNEIKNYWNTIIGKKLKVHYQETPSSSSKKPSNRTSENPERLRTKNADTDTHLFRTKASRCTKVFITTPSESKPKVDDHQLLDTKVTGQHQQSLPPEFQLEKYNESDDFMIDFEIDESWLSAFLNTDFSDFDNNENNSNGGGGGNSNAFDNNHCSSPNSSRSFLLSHQDDQKLLHDQYSDFPSMESLVGSELEWFRE